MFYHKASVKQHIGLEVIAFNFIQLDCVRKLNSIVDIDGKKRTLNGLYSRFSEIELTEQRLGSLEAAKRFSHFG